MKKILIINMLCALSLKAMESNLENALKIKDSSVRASHRLGKIELYHSDNGFHVLKDDMFHEVKAYDIDPVLKNMTKKQLTQFLAGTSIRVNQLNNEDYKLTLEGGLKGGGVGGAWLGFWIGKLAVHAAAQTTYAVAAGATFLVFPPAAPVVFYTLQSTFAIPVETASNVIGCGTAIAGGTVTGPV